MTNITKISFHMLQKFLQIDVSTRRKNSIDSPGAIPAVVLKYYFILFQVLEDDGLEPLKILKECKNIYERKLQSRRKKARLENQSVPQEMEIDLNTVIEKHSSILKIPKLSDSEFFDFLKKQNNRFEPNINKPTPSNTENDQEEIQHSTVDFLRILTDSDVINLIKNKLINKQD